jgi:hypothetical protein
MNTQAAISLIVLSAMLGACSPTRPTVTATGGPTQVQAPSPTSPSPTLSPPTGTPAPALSFESATYADSAGFAFEFPAQWTVVPRASGGDRGSFATLTSWAHPPGLVPEVPVGGTILQATVQLWDPKNDLEAFLAQRHAAWDGSGIQVVSEERSTLANGQPTARYIVRGSDGSEGFFFFTTLEDDYLVLSGSGDLGLLAEIAGTLRRTASSDY